MPACLYADHFITTHFPLATDNVNDSYISAVTEIITGREEDLCLAYEAANPGSSSSGKAKNNMGTANMDISRSEIACEKNEPCCRRETAEVLSIIYYVFTFFLLFLMYIFDVSCFWMPPMVNGDFVVLPSYGISSAFSLKR